MPAPSFARNLDPKTRKYSGAGVKSAGTSFYVHVANPEPKAKPSAPRSSKTPTQKSSASQPAQSILFSPYPGSEWKGGGALTKTQQRSMDKAIKICAARPVKGTPHVSFARRQHRSV
jgi:hypothetical protein